MTTHIVSLVGKTQIKPCWKDTNEVTSSCVQIRESCSYSSEELRALCNQVMEGLFCSKEERMKIEFTTRQQSNCSLWHQVRYKRITGSKCGQILKQSSVHLLFSGVFYTARNWIQFQHLYDGEETMKV